MAFVLSSGSLNYAQYYGMSFSGLEVSLDQRSSLDLTPHRAIDADADLNLQFHIRLRPGDEGYYGYIFRLLVGEQNIDLVHGVVPGNPNNFELILGKKTSNIAFYIPVEDLFKEWIRLKITIDSRNQRISLHLRDTVFEDQLKGYDLSDGVRLMFGAHSYGKFSRA
ncbi:unnamed protein product, partial [marine sediment metagenome]